MHIDRIARILSALGFFLICLSAQPALAQVPPGQLIVRVFFGQQMGGVLLGPCSDITIQVDVPNKPPIKKAAVGPSSGAKGGYCTATLSSVPAGVPLTLKALYADFPSVPEPNYKPPGGQWKNPITLKGNEKAVRYIQIDGKP